MQTGPPFVLGLGMSVGWELQKAVFAALDAALAADVYDNVPHKAEMPYVVIDNQLAVDTQAVNRARETVTLYLSVYTRGAGQKEALEIMADIKATLHNQKLALDSGTLESMFVLREGTGRDIDDSIFTGQVTVRAIIAP